MTDVLNSLSKSQQLSGEEHEWRSWKLSLLLYLGAVDLEGRNGDEKQDGCDVC